MKWLIVILFAIALSSCKKDDPEPATKSNFLTNGTWMVSAVTSDDDGDGIYETNDYADFLDCFKDNIHTFHSNGTFEMNEGPSKCDPGDPQTESSTWQLTNNDSNLNLANDVYTVQQLTNTTLQVKLSYGDNRSSIVTFTKR
jgi:hypothetical protein